MILNAFPNERALLQHALRSAAGWTRAQPDKVAILDELLGTLSHEEFPGAIVPRLRQGAMVYYAVTETAEQWRNLQPLLRAFVGSTLTDFSGQPSALDATDPFEVVLTDPRLGTVTRFSAHGNKKLERHTVDALLLMVRTFDRGARPQRAVPPATAAVLYEFRMALAVGDRDKADQAIEFLRSNLRLDALNLKFLEVQRDAEFGEWETLRQRSFFKSLCETRRPPKVTSALAEALYRTDLIAFEVGDDPNGALEHFRSKIQPEFGALFRTCPPSPRPAVAKLFMLAAAASAPPDRQLMAALAEQANHFPAAEVAFAARLAQLLPAYKPVQVDLALPNTAFFMHQLMIAQDLDLEATAEGARAALLAAASVQSLEGYYTAVDYVNRLAPAEQQTVIDAPFFQDLWQRMNQFVGGQGGVPQSWQEWAESLVELSFSEARTFAEQAVEEWPIAKHLSSPSEVEALAAALGAAWVVAEERLADSLPHLVAWVRNDERWPNPDFRTLYEAVLNLLLLSSNRSSAVLTAISILVEGRLSLGMEPEKYQQLFTDLRALVEESASASTIDWLVDLAELTVVYPCPDQSARMALWSVTASHLGLLRTRMNRAQLGIVADIATTLDVPETFPLLPESPELEEAPDSAIQGVVAIYTLANGVGERARRILEPLYPHLRIELFHDHVTSPRLQQYARTADLFVICWMAAKHAATIDIRAKRPTSLSTVWAQGGGSSSVVNAVRTHFSSKSA